MPMGLRIRLTSLAATSFVLAFASVGIAPVARAAKPIDFGTTGRASTAVHAARAAGTTGVSATAAVSNVRLCAALNDQTAPVYVPDGNGGGIAVWADGRNGNYDIYAQKVNESGDTVWGIDGVPVCKAVGPQINPQLVADGAGGVIVVWEDGRADATGDIYAQRLTASGVELWTPDGVLVASTPEAQQAPVVVTDALGGAIAIWKDARSGAFDLYARRIGANGVVQWAANGAPVSVAAGDQDEPAAIADGAGGALIAWRDRRGANADVYAQRISGAGVAAWAVDGVAVCAAAGDQEPPSVVADGTGGVIAAWGDGRGANLDVYAQRMNASGVAQWAAKGSRCARRPATSSERGSASTDPTAASSRGKIAVAPTPTSTRSGSATPARRCGRRTASWCAAPRAIS